MPNHVTNKIVFDKTYSEKVFAEVCPNGKFDFELLIPQPLNIYRGDLSGEDESDFPLNWRSWNIENWGTKWNCYEQECGINEEGKAYIKFDTAWSIPYPIISAFNNKFNISFIHKYYDEGHNYWGIEEWNIDNYPLSNKLVHRISKRYMDVEDEKVLCIELKGYDPDSIENDNECED